MANNSWEATGRRKRSIAQVSICYGKGKIEVNGVDVNTYFPFKTLVMDLKQPLVYTDNESKFDISVKVSGGGFNGQAGAIRLGIAKALLMVDNNNREILKSKGMITRDSRIKERKKYGLKKARRAPQFSKR